MNFTYWKSYVSRRLSNESYAIFFITHLVLMFIGLKGSTNLAIWTNTDAILNSCLAGVTSRCVTMFAWLSREFTQCRSSLPVVLVVMFMLHILSSKRSSWSFKDFQNPVRCQQSLAIKTAKFFLPWNPKQTFWKSLAAWDFILGARFKSDCFSRFQQ